MKTHILLFRALKLVWYQFAEITSIHGLKFIMDKQGNMFTRTIWIIMTFGGFIASNILVATFWERYKSNPTRLSIASTHVPLNLLKMPAITICQINRVDNNRAYTLIDKLLLPENTTKDMVFDYMAQAAGFIDNVDYNVEELQQMHEILTANNYTTLQATEYLHQPCNQLMIRCRYQYKIQPCEDLFVDIMSYHGSCCTFNKFKSTKFFDVAGGLSVVFSPPSNVRSYSSTYSEGVKLLVHDKRIYPSDLSVEKMISHKSESIVYVAATKTECSQEVRDLSTKDRECLFVHEKKLQFFDDYKENNCDVECRVRKIILYCGCLPYYFQHLTNKVPTCNFKQIECLVNNYFKIHESRVKSNKFCICPSNCNAIVFDVQTIRIPFKPNKFSIDPFYNDLNRTHMILHLIFGKQVFKEMRRDLLTNIVSLAAGLGGIYSLFIGMSVITFFEILYFFTIRLWATYTELKDADKNVDTFRKRLNKQPKRKLQIQLNQISHH